MYAKTIISSKGQIVIPKHMREFLGLHYGSELILNLRKDNALEVYHKTSNIKDFFGKRKIKNQKKEMTVKDIDDAIAQTIIGNPGN